MLTWAYAWYCKNTEADIPLLFITAMLCDLGIATAITSIFVK